jgi:hypothetical protein
MDNVKDDLVSFLGSRNHYNKCHILDHQKVNLLMAQLWYHKFGSIFPFNYNHTTYHKSLRSFQ